MTSLNKPRMIESVLRPDHACCVPHSVLIEIVQRDGMCMRLVIDDEPAWLGEDVSDRELAELLCADCMVQDECLELEFRTAGVNTVGVWGALPEEERRAVYLRWLHLDDCADDGGEAR